MTPRRSHVAVVAILAALLGGCGQKSVPVPDTARIITRVMGFSSRQVSRRRSSSLNLRRIPCSCLRRIRFSSIRYAIVSCWRRFNQPTAAANIRRKGNASTTAGESMTSIEILSFQ